MLKGVFLRKALHLDKISGRKAVHRLIRIHGGRKNFHNDRIGKIGQRKLQNGLLVPDVPSLVRHDLSADRDLSHLSDDVGNRHRIVIKLTSADDFRPVRANKAPDRLVLRSSLLRLLPGSLHRRAVCRCLKTIHRRKLLLRLLRIFRHLICRKLRGSLRGSLRRPGSRCRFIQHSPCMVADRQIINHRNAAVHAAPLPEDLLQNAVNLYSAVSREA